MIEESGRAIAVDSNAIWVETIRKTTCTSCNARHGCGQHLAEKYKSNQSHSYIRVTNNSGYTVREQDEVVIGIPENSLLKASMLIYFLPLLSMMLGLWVGHLFGRGDLITMLCGISALALGFLPVRHMGSKAGDMCQVQLLKVIPRRLDETELITVSS